MVQLSTKTLTLEEFLKLPDTKPASEYINGQVIQKPMPQGKHSKLQGKLVTAINEVVESRKISNYTKLITVCSERSEAIPAHAIASFRCARVRNDTV